ncbi:slightly ste11-like protein [Conoideocrella luteorostrata]|uniref:Slightly ste11-like protein n=1 Tax=Conoideocrella luteorostrata TaxID=1105319 RepID=A0AAJ0FS63_9HYPO|nr:slightly ste11-like protein [Conoideocrella luteorostrata]
MKPRTQIQDGEVLDSPVTFVISEAQGDVHIFIPETYHGKMALEIAGNFSRLIQQPVSIFHDVHRQKLRICPIPPEATVDTTSYGALIFRCDSTASRDSSVEKNTAEAQDSPPRIPRPRNSWILYRQSKSQELRKGHVGITASELSTVIASLWKHEPREVKAFWQNMALEEDRLHKRKYPNYKEKLMFCIDGTNPDRVYIGAPRHFVGRNGSLFSPGCGEPYFFAAPRPRYPARPEARPAARANTAAICPQTLDPNSSTRIPRPPNAYILYRKERHSAVKMANPGISNNEICEYPPHPGTARPST